MKNAMRIMKMLSGLRLLAALSAPLLALALLAAPAQAAETGNILLLTVHENGQNDVVAIKLRPDLAPQHVERIKKLAQEGAYNNIVFHRVIEGFMAQTGDVQYGKRGGDTSQAGMGGSSYPNLPAEFSSAPFVRGTVGMARAQDPNSANSQFFICYGDASFLNGQYTVVGEVVKGMDAVDGLKKGSAEENGAVRGAADYIVRAELANAAP